MTVKRNPFAKKSQNSFLNLVGMITESDEMDETEGLDFDDEAEGEDLGEDDFADDDMGDDEFGTEEDGDTVTLSIPRSLAMELMDALQAVIDGEEGDDEFGDDEFGDDDMAEDDELGDDEFGDEDFDEDFEDGDTIIANGDHELKITDGDYEKIIRFRLEYEPLAVSGLISILISFSFAMIF